ncbi:MAG: chromate efflux transporter [Pseudomonadota bacterium]
MTQPVTIGDLTKVFGRIGLLSFGGPAAQIALMHSELVERQKWLSEETYLRALSLCMLLPGPEAMQLATYAGWRLRGTLGGLLAGLLFVGPGAAVIFVLALAYASFGTVPLVQAAFAGIKAVVIVIVLQALMRLRKTALRTPLAWGLAGAAFIGLFLFDLPYPLIIAGAAVTGALTADMGQRHADPPPAKAFHPVPVILTWAGLWAAPIIMIGLLDHDLLMQISLFFSKLAVVTFGGAYAVLAYMTQTVVADYGWITTPQMIDALGLAETTPGPLILVTQFVAMLAGFNEDGVGLAILAGAVTLWVTFVPCFLWIFLAGPYLDQIAAHPRLAAALRAITAAVVGVILNLALWFAIHTVFHETQVITGISSPLPNPALLDLQALILTLIAAWMIFVAKRGLGETLAILAAAGLICAFLWPL